MSTSAPRRRVGITLLVLGMAAAVVGLLAPGATADGARARFVGPAAGLDLVGTLPDGSTRLTAAGVFQLEIDGRLALAYCMDFATRVGREYREADWSATGVRGEQIDKINWILHNSFPRVSVAELNARLGLSGVTLDRGKAAAATQAAIWHFSDGYVLDTTTPTEVAEDGTVVTNGGTDPAVQALYELLTGPANTGLASEPGFTLDVEPNSVPTARAGDRVGPFTVRTNAGAAGVVASLPALVVDADGNPVDRVVDGGEVFVDIPADAPARSDAWVWFDAGQTVVSTGRVFVGADGQAAQILVLAEDAPARVGVGVDLAWTSDHPGDGSLPPTTTVSGTPAPSASAELDCSTGALRVTVSNEATATADAQVAVIGPDGFWWDETLAPGESAVVDVPVAEGLPYTVDVVSGTFRRTFEGTRQCGPGSPGGELPPWNKGAPELSVEVREACELGGLGLQLVNRGLATLDLVVTGPSGETQPVRVPPVTTVTVVVPAADGPYRIDITGEGISRRLTGIRACDETPATTVPHTTVPHTTVPHTGVPTTTVPPTTAPTTAPTTTAPTTTAPSGSVAQEPTTTSPAPSTTPATTAPPTTAPVTTAPVTAPTTAPTSAPVTTAPPSMPSPTDPRPTVPPTRQETTATPFEGGLPRTGLQVGSLLGVAVVLLVGGTLLLVGQELTRRRPGAADRQR